MSVWASSQKARQLLQRSVAREPSNSASMRWSTSTDGGNNRSARVRSVMAWLRWKARRRRLETNHTPSPSAAACLVKRVADTASSASSPMNLSSIRKIRSVFEPPAGDATGMTARASRAQNDRRVLRPTDYRQASSRRRSPTGSDRKSSKVRSGRRALRYRNWSARLPSRNTTIVENRVLFASAARSSSTASTASSQESSRGGKPNRAISLWSFPCGMIAHSPGFSPLGA